MKNAESGKFRTSPHPIPSFPPTPPLFKLSAPPLLLAFHPMKVFVTGGAGYIGSVCVED
jgi:hypothetical protein